MIIAIKQEDKTIVAFSNCDAYAYFTEKDLVDDDNIALKFSGDKLIGFADMDRRSDIFFYDKDFLNMEITPKNLVREVVPYVKQKLKDNDKPIDDNGNWGNAIVFCQDNHIYGIDPYFGVYEADDYVCHGYRIEAVRSCLDQTKGLPAEERILKAIDFSCKLKRENLYPLVIADTSTKQIKRVMQGESK